MNEVIKIGRSLDNESTEVKFDITEIAERVGSGATYSLRVQRNGDPAAYPVSDSHYSVSGNTLTWIPYSEDLSKPGRGMAQIKAQVSDSVAMSKVYVLLVGKSLSATEQVPDPWTAWVDEVKEYRDEAKESAEAVENMTASASVDSTTGTPTVVVTKTEGAEGYNLDFAFSGIKGADGGGGTWGSITGNLSEQTDLNTALNGKEVTTNKVTSLSSSSTDTQYPSAKCVYDELADKQDTLVSGTNIKTVNNNSLLGSGDLSIGGGLELKNSNPALPPKPASPVSDLSDYTWDQINAIALSGQAADYFALGATKSVTLTAQILGTVTHDVQIVGINIDSSNSITFCTVNTLNTATIFMPYGSIDREDLWKNSTARGRCSAYYNALPFKQYVLPVNKTTKDYYGGDKTNLETAWLASRYEMGYAGALLETTVGVSVSYPYFDSDEKRIKYTSNSDASRWWMRSRKTYPGGSQAVYTVYTDGSGTSAADADNSIGIRLVPFFVIGNDAEVTYWLEQDGTNENTNVKKALDFDSKVDKQQAVADAGKVLGIGNDGVVTPVALPEGLPTAPSSDGSYLLVCQVTSGTPTYSWVSYNP